MVGEEALVVQEAVTADVAVEVITKLLIEVTIVEGVKVETWVVVELTVEVMVATDDVGICKQEQIVDMACEGRPWRQVGVTMGVRVIIEALLGADPLPG